MNNLKRFTVCKLAGHKGLRIEYPPLPTEWPAVSSCAVSDAARRTTRQAPLPEGGGMF
jgi:hypothetical protein